MHRTLGAPAGQGQPAGQIGKDSSRPDSARGATSDPGQQRALSDVENALQLLTTQMDAFMGSQSGEAAGSATAPAAERISLVPGEQRSGFGRASVVPRSPSPIRAGVASNSRESPELPSVLPRKGNGGYIHLSAGKSSPVAGSVIPPELDTGNMGIARQSSGDGSLLAPGAGSPTALGARPGARAGLTAVDQASRTAPGNVLAAARNSAMRQATGPEVSASGAASNRLSQTGGNAGARMSKSPGPSLSNAENRSHSSQSRPTSLQGAPSNVYGGLRRQDRP